MIGLIIGEVIGFVKLWWQGRQEIAKSKQEMKKAELENRARLLREEQSNNHEWEMAALTDKDKWIRRLSFIMFSAPFVVAIVSPEHVKIYFDTAISSIPNWFKDTWVAINGAIWGISALKNPISQMANAFSRK